MPDDNLGAVVFFEDLFGGDAQFARKNLEHARLAKSALATSHACADATFDRIDRRRWKRCMDRLDDLALAHTLATADDFSELRILRNFLRAFVVREFVHHGATRKSYDVFFFR